MTSQHAALSAAVNSTQARGRFSAQDIEDTLAALDRLGYLIVRAPGRHHGPRDDANVSEGRGSLPVVQTEGSQD